MATKRKDAPAPSPNEEAGLLAEDVGLGSDGKRAGDAGYLGLENPHGMSWQRGALTMMAEIVGMGVLGLAYACARVGWGLGLSFNVFFGCASLFSSMLLARVHAASPRLDSYEAAAQRLVGPRFAGVTRALVNLNWALILPYFLMASANALAVAFWWLPAGYIVCYYDWALLSVVLLVIPTQIRSLEALSTLTSASVAAICVVLVLIAGAFVAGGKGDDVGSEWGVPADSGVLQAFDSISTMTFAYQGQSMLFEIASEMRRGDEFPKATLCANASLLVLYLAAMAVGYAYEGDHVAGFLPDSVPDGPAKTVIGFLLYFHVMITYLVNNQPLSKKIFEALWPPPPPPPGAAVGFTGGAHGAIAGSAERKEYDGGGGALGDAFASLGRGDGRAGWAAITLVLLLWSYLIANLVPWFADFQAIMGSLLGAPIMFFYPVLFYVLLARETGTAIPPLTLAGCVFVGGVIFPVAWVIGTVAAFDGLVQDWTSENGVFACIPSGYSR